MGTKYLIKWQGYYEEKKFGYKPNNYMGNAKKVIDLFENKRFDT